jgi:hypothetical protein
MAIWCQYGWVADTLLLIDLLDELASIQQQPSTLTPPTATPPSQTSSLAASAFIQPHLPAGRDLDISKASTPLLGTQQL